MPNVVDIIFRSIDQTGPVNKNIISNLNSLSKSVLGFGLDAAGAALAIAKITAYVTKVTDETQKYNLSIIDLARNMGTTTEEASRLVQVGDDVRISQQSIEMAMKFAIRNGIEPNIEGIAKLADEYVALETPVEKGQLLLKAFGRSGLEMSKMMEKGGDGIREMSKGIESGLIVTEAAAKASEAYFRNTDALNDSMEALNRTLGNQTIPIVSNVNFILANSAKGWTIIFDKIVPGVKAATLAEDVWNKSIITNARALFQARIAVEKLGLGAEGAAEAYREWEIRQTALNVSMGETSNTVREAGEEINTLKTRTDEGGNSVREMADAFDQLKQHGEKSVMAVTEAVDLMQGAIGGAFGKEDSDFSKSMQGLKDNAAGLVSSIKELEGKRWLSKDQKQDLKDLKQDLADNKQAMTDLATEHTRATQSMILDMIIQKASSEGFTANEIANISAIAVQWGLWDEKTASVIESINTNAANLNTDKPKEFAAYIDAIFKYPATKQFNFNVAVNVTETIMNAYHWQSGNANDTNP